MKTGLRAQGFENKNFKCYYSKITEVVIINLCSLTHILKIQFYITKPKKDKRATLPFINGFNLQEKGRHSFVGASIYFKGYLELIEEWMMENYAWNRKAKS